MQDKDVLAGLFREGDGKALSLMDGQQQRLCWSWSELQQQRRYAESVLRMAGLAEGDRVLLVSANNPQFFALLLAGISLQLCVVPLHNDVAVDTLQHILATQPPALVIIDDLRLLSRLSTHKVMQLWETNSHWLQTLQGSQDLQARSGAVAATTKDSGVLLFHSSGSTGKPKGIRYDRALLTTFLQHLALLYAAFPDDPTDLEPTARVNVLPVTHWGGLSFCLQALLERRHLYLLRNHTAEDHLAVLRQTDCRLLLMVPALLQELVHQPQQQSEPILPAVRHCLAMGEAIGVAQLQQLSERLGVRVHNAYGMSECLSGIFNTSEDVHVPMGSCGRLRFGEVRLLGNDGGEADEGELCIRNPTTQPCYTDPALNAAKYFSGWYHSGDRLRRDNAGNYFFLGRVDSLCVIDGRNVYPREVEAVMLAHPAVRDCVAAPITTTTSATRLALAVELRVGANVGANALLDYYLAQGARYATPVWLQFHPSLPRLGSGKPDRLRCRQQLQDSYEQARSLQSRQSAA